MINNFRIIFSSIFILIPLALITGPAVPDIIISTSCLFALIWFYLNEKTSILIKIDIVRISILLWLSLILISFFAFDKIKSLQDSLIFLRFLLIPICCYFLYLKANYLNYLILIIFVLVIFVSIDSLYQFFNYSSEYGFGEDIFGFSTNWYGRLTGPFGDELIPGSYISKFGLIGYVYLLLNKKIKYKVYVKSFYLALILVVCFVSGERMAFATYSLALFLLIFLDRSKITIILAILLGLLAIFTIYKFHPFYNDFKVIESNEYHQGLKIEKSFTCEENNNKICKKIIDVQPSFVEIIRNFSSSAYGEIYLLSYQMFKDNPVSGIGLSNFYKLCISDNKYKSLMINYDCASHPHNTYVQWLTEGGLIVFLIFILYIVVLIRFILDNEGDKDYKVISLLLILILFWPIMSTGSLIKNWYGIIVFFIVGVSLCISKLKTNY